MPELTIRSIDEEDIPVLLQIQSQLTRSTIDDAVQTFRRMLIYPFYRIYLAFLDDLAVGTFALLIMDNLGHKCTPIAVVENVIVHHTRRRQGIGRRMLQHAAQVGREHGCYKMILATNLKLEEAHRFYDSLGFTQQGYAMALEL
jgi:GNAT superfamily N-acetyltransferase